MVSVEPNQGLPILDAGCRLVHHVLMGRPGELFDQDLVGSNGHEPEAARRPELPSMPSLPPEPPAQPTPGPPPRAAAARSAVAPRPSNPASAGRDQRGAPAPVRSTRVSRHSRPLATSSAPPSAGPGAGGAPPEHPSLGRSTTVLASGTLLSRLTGFLRVLVVTSVLGLNGLGDAYNFANSIPNIVYDLLLGGVLAATLIPVFVDELGRKDRRAGARSISAVLTAVTVALALVSIALYFSAPWVIRFYLILNHSAVAADERTVGTRLLRLFAPQVFLIGITVVSAALLNARRRFGAAAFSPVANNLIAIAAILATKAVVDHVQITSIMHDQKAIFILGAGTTLGYLVQFIVQLPAMVRAKLVFRPVWDMRDPAVRKVVGLSAWLVGVVISNQISVNLIAVVAGRVPGNYTAYQAAYQFFLLPYALFAVSIASAITPNLAEHWGKGDRLGFQRQIIRGLRVTLALLVPAAAGYGLISGSLIDLTLRYGRVSASGAHLVSSTLAFFAVGLPGFSAFLLLMRAFQAMKDTKTMFFLYAVENGLSVVLTFVLYPLMGVRGLAVAWVGPYTVVAVFAAIYLARRTGSLGASFTLRSLGRVALATTASALVVFFVGVAFPPRAGHLLLAVRLVLQVGSGLSVYLAAARLLGISDVEVLTARLARFRRRIAL